MAAKRIELTNLTRDRILIPVADGGNADDGKLIDLGDKLDVDDRVPAGHERDPKRMPAPVAIFDSTKLGVFAHKMIDDQVAQGRIRRTELAA